MLFLILILLGGPICVALIFNYIEKETTKTIYKLIDEFCIKTNYNWNHDEWRNLITDLRNIDHEFYFYNNNNKKVHLKMFVKEDQDVIGEYLERRKKEHNIVKEYNKKIMGNEYKEELLT